MIDKKDIEGMNSVYKELAEKIGIENTLVIYDTFKGSQISFPTSLFSTNYIHECISEEYNGSNIKELSRKYSYSERTIRRIIQGKFSDK